MIQLREITEDDLVKVMNWRMQPDITRYMNTDPVLTLEKQKKWLEQIQKDNTVMYWIIVNDNVPVGVINLADIDWKNKTSSWGYYIAEKKYRSLKLAISLEMSLYKFVFEYLGFTHIHNEAFVKNQSVIKIHEACGNEILYIEKEGVLKNGEKYDVVHMDETFERWKKYSERIKYDKIVYPVPDWLALEVDHIGYAVNSIDKSLKEFMRLGFSTEGMVTRDLERKVNIMFLTNEKLTERIELIESIDVDSPISKRMDMMHKVAHPYHMCYKVKSIDMILPWLKAKGYIQIDKKSPAPAIFGNNVVFLMNKEIGIIELLEIV